MSLNLGVKRSEPCVKCTQILAQVSDVNLGENKGVNVSISWTYNDICPTIDLILGLIISKNVSHMATDIYKCAFISQFYSLRTI